MGIVGRVAAALDRELEASASSAWALVTDWAGFPMAAKIPGLESSTLVGEPSDIPCVRRLRFAGGMDLAEELFYQNDETRRYYCRIFDSELSPWRGYIASLFIDEIDADRCMVRLRAWCDTVDPAAADDIRTFVEKGWDDGIVAGLRRLCGTAEPPDL